MFQKPVAATAAQAHSADARSSPEVAEAEVLAGSRLTQPLRPRVAARPTRLPPPPPPPARAAIG